MKAAHLPFEPKVKMTSPGRSTDYEPSHGIELIRFMAGGLSISAAAAAMGVSRATIYVWARQHPEFSEALKKAKGARVLHLERKLLDAIDGASVRAAIFALKNAAPEEWGYKRRHEPDLYSESPLAALYRKLLGTAIRPKLPQKATHRD